MSAISQKSDKLYEEYEYNKDNSFESKYTYGRVLGEGAHSTVKMCHKIEDKEKRFPFAVKITRLDDPEKKMAIKNEFYITQNLNH